LQIILLHVQQGMKKDRNPAGVRGIFKVKKLSPALLSFGNFAEFYAHNPRTRSGSAGIRQSSARFETRSGASVFIVKPADIVFSQVAAGLDLN
jgi:hypothetical protein